MVVVGNDAEEVVVVEESYLVYQVGERVHNRVGGAGHQIDSNL